MPAGPGTPIVNLCAAVRQGSGCVEDFFRHVRALDETGFQVGMITVVVDGTEIFDPALRNAAAGDSRLRIVLEGGPIATVETMAERSVGWAQAANLALEASLDHPSDRTLWVEADLDFDADLVRRLLLAGGDIVAPRVHCDGRFYDTWGFRTKAGRRIRFDKQLLSLDRKDGLIELASVGSCLLFPTEILRRGVRLPGNYPDGLLVGFCLEASRRGYRVACAPEIIVRHPSEAWAKQLYSLSRVTVEGADGDESLQDIGAHSAAGPYAEFIAHPLRKLLRRRLLSARLGLLRYATYRFALTADQGLDIRVRLGGETASAPGFSRVYPLYPRRLRDDFAAIGQRLSLGLLKRFGRNP